MWGLSSVLPLNLYFFPRLNIRTTTVLRALAKQFLAVVILRTWGYLARPSPIYIMSILPILGKAL